MLLESDVSTHPFLTKFPKLSNNRRVIIEYGRVANIQTAGDFATAIIPSASTVGDTEWSCTGGLNQGCCSLDVSYSIVLLSRRYLGIRADMTAIRRE